MNGDDSKRKAKGFLSLVLIRSLVIIIIAMFLYQYFEGSFLSCAMMRLTVSQFSQLPLSKV